MLFFLFLFLLKPRLFPILFTILFPLFLLDDPFPSDSVLFTLLTTVFPIDSIEFVIELVIELGDGREIFGIDGMGTLPDVKKERIPYIMNMTTAKIITAGAYILRPSCHVLRRYSAANIFW